VTGVNQLLEWVLDENNSTIENFVFGTASDETLLVQCPVQKEKQSSEEWE
jgi:hypothetical protein